MSEFYTSVCRYGNNILYRGYDAAGNPVKKSYQFKPTLFVSSNNKSEWRSISGSPVEPIFFDSMREAGDFLKQYEYIPNIEVHGMTNYVTQFINSRFPNEIQPDTSLVNIAYIDIEVASDEGFPEPDKADHQVISICMRLSTSPTYIVWALNEYEVKRDDVKYVKCAGETDLLLKFAEFWRTAGVDVVTGWNIRLFDMPYLINRISKVIGEDTAKKLSPWGVIKERTFGLNGKTQQAYEIYGIEQLDYYDLFQKFNYAYGEQESYKLDHIAHVVLDKKKINYEEHGNLHTLYKEDYQKFIDYNIRDVELVYFLEEKLGLILLAFTIAYKAGSNYTDAFGTTALWDNYIYRSLDKQKVAVPPKQNRRKEVYAGGYVKAPAVGRHEWVVSFDLNSLYPHLIMQYNMSPETIMDVRTDGVTVDNCLSGKRPAPADSDSSMAANGVHFRNDVRGVIPGIIDGLYAERSQIKKNMLKVKQEVKSGDKKNEKHLSKLDTQQQAIKIMMNSLYGAMGNCWFRYYDVRLAEGITLSGQLSIRWAERAVNDYMNKILKTNNVDYVIAIDTDSLYVNFGSMVKKVVSDTTQKEKIIDALSATAEKNFLPEIAKAYNKLSSYMNAYENRMVMGREVIADVGIWTAKKRYILNVHDSEGVRYKEPELKIMGIEAVKSSTPQSCRQALKELFKVIISGTESDVQKAISMFRQHFYKLPAHEVAFPRGVSNVTKFRDAATLYVKGTPAHVRAALLYNSQIEKHNLTNRYTQINNGDKIKFLYLTEPNPIRENIFGFPDFLPKELGLDKYVDYDTQFEKAFLAVVEPILKAIGWSHKEVSTLDAFF